MSRNDWLNPPSSPTSAKVLTHWWVVSFDSGAPEAIIQKCMGHQSLTYAKETGNMYHFHFKGDLVFTPNEMDNSSPYEEFDCDSSLHTEELEF